MSFGLGDITGAMTGGLVGEDVYGIWGDDEAAEAAEKGAATTAAAQRESLEYLKEREAQPQFYREQALQQLGAYYGLPQYTADTGMSQDDHQANVDKLAELQARRAGMGDPGGSMIQRAAGGAMVKGMDSEIAALEEQIAGYEPSVAQDPMQGQQDFIQGVKQSPFYESMISEGEDAASRFASMGGMRRSGNLESRYVQNSQDVLQRLVNERLSGITGMANLPSNVPQIAQGISGVGQTIGQGQIAAGQIQQQGQQNRINTALGIGSMMI